MKKTLENRQSFTRKLMQLLVLMAMLLAPKGAWAEASDYDLWVGGVQVTVANATSGITGSNITNGTVTFDASTNTLTLNKATVTGSYSSGGSPILSRLDALTIVIKGSCVLSSSDSCTAIRAEGTGDHVLTLKSGDTSCSLQFSVERAIRDKTELACVNAVRFKIFQHRILVMDLDDPVKIFRMNILPDGPSAD